MTRKPTIFQRLWWVITPCPRCGRFYKCYPSEETYEPRHIYMANNETPTTKGTIMPTLEDLARDIRNSQLIRFGDSGKTLDEFLSEPGEARLTKMLEDLAQLIREQHAIV